ncbi:universal stress protein [Balneola sp. MJW-20]|uniref:universal stress protein n=1 Tax=Gracilimonas aurantiaca TaxID=3234185 RepID=UPI0034678824
MAKNDKWLIATNGTKYASEAVKYAATLFRDLRNEPEVHILVVAVDEKAEDEAKGIMELAKYLFDETAGKEGNVNIDVDTGEPGKVIIENMKKLNATHLFIGGADFKWDINDDKPGGISNYIIEHLDGAAVTLLK